MRLRNRAEAISVIERSVLSLRRLGGVRDQCWRRQSHGFARKFRSQRIQRLQTCHSLCRAPDRFVVIAVGAGHGQLWQASVGALAACAIVLIIGLFVHKPLSRVPENTLKFGVGVMLSAFGVFWTGEGLGIAWPGQDLTIVGFAAVFLATGLALVASLQRPTAELNS